VSKWVRVAVVLFATVVALTVSTGVATAQVLEGEMNAGEQASPFERWQYILGVVLPLVTAWLMAAGWSSRTKALFMLAVSAVACLGTMYLQGDLNDVSATNVVDKFLGLVVLVIGFYYGVWKPTGLAPRLEVAPTPLRVVGVESGPAA
jgi:amino acid permease